jgi:hypothetical protein
MIDGAVPPAAPPDHGAELPRAAEFGSAIIEMAIAGVTVRVGRGADAETIAAGWRNFRALFLCGDETVRFVSALRALGEFALTVFNAALSGSFPKASGSAGG